MPSAVSHVFEVTELQDCIFVYLGKNEQAKCARVCKSWSNAAVYRLWNELDSVVPLLRVLGEFTADGRALSVGLLRKTARTTRTTSYSLTFSGEPSDERWARFHFYAALISTLRLSNYSNYDCVPLFTRTSPVLFGRAVLQIISNGQKHPRLLPNVVNLHVNASVDASIFSLATLLFGQLKGLELVIDVTPHRSLFWTPLKRFLTNILSLSPDLQCFSIKATPGAETRWHGESLARHSELDQIIRDYLLHMRTSLTTVKVNSTLFTPELFDMLSNFPCIRSIQNSGRRAYHTPKPLQISSRIADGAFPALKSLFLPIEENTGITTFAMLGHTLENLTSFSVVCHDYLSSLKCHDLIVAISQSCPALLSLEVIACTSRNAIGGHTNATAQWREDNSSLTSRERRMDCLSLAPLFELRSLKELTLQVFFVLPITDLELEQVLSRRKIPFDVLQLSWTPRRFDIDRPKLTLKALDIIAHHCPTVRILSIFIMVEDTSFMSSCSSFRCLEELNMGLSIIPPHLLNQTAAMLCKLFRDGLPEFSASQHTGHFNKCQIDAERVRGVLKNYKNWEKVIRIANKSKGVVNGRELCSFARSERRVFDPSVGNRIPHA